MPSSDTSCGPGPRPTGWLLAAVILALPAATLLGQQVPGVNDVYSSGRRPIAAPATTDPAVIMGRARTTVARSRAIRYDARLRATGAWAATYPKISATVLTATARANGRPAYRITLHGETPEATPLIATIGCDGQRVYVIDMIKRTVTTAPTWSAELDYAAWVEYLIPLPDPDPAVDHFDFTGPVTVAREPCYGLHHCQAARREHVYASYSSIDGLLRDLDRVSADVQGHVGSVRVTMTNIAIDPPLLEDAFAMSPPQGFLRVDLSIPPAR